MTYEQQWCVNIQWLGITPEDDKSESISGITHEEAVAHVANVFKGDLANKPMLVEIYNMIDHPHGHFVSVDMI